MSIRRHILFLTQRACTAAWLAACLAIAVVEPASAARNFPQNSRQVRISQVADDAIVADGQALHLAPGLVVFTPTNATIVRSTLHADVIARIQVDLNGDVRRIWLLAEDEVLVRPWWQIWKRDQPEGQPNDPSRLIPAER